MQGPPERLLAAMIEGGGPGEARRLHDFSLTPKEESKQQALDYLGKIKVSGDY